MRRKVFIGFHKEIKLFVKYGYKDAFVRIKFNLQNARICETHFENSCYESDTRNEQLGLEPRRLLKPGSVPTLNLPTTHTYPSDCSERALRAKKGAQPTADHVIVHDTTLAVTRPRRRGTETEVLRMNVQQQKSEIARLKTDHLLEEEILSGTKQT